MTTRLRARGVAAAAAGVAVCVGVGVAFFYAQVGLTLSHYDARGHLVVARRIFDSLTPGWQQIGAVWLPLPHLLNALPVQIDLFYRTGASGVAISIASFAVTAGAAAWIIRRLTGSDAAAAIGATLLVANPNVLYLQSTPMTEPLLLATVAVSVALLVAWTDGDCDAAAPGWALALACLTRYEAWPITIAALAATAFTSWRHGATATSALRKAARVAVYPALAVVAFLVFSRATVGEWFIASGFFVPENKSLGSPVLSASEIFWGTHELSGDITLTLTSIGALLLIVRGLLVRRDAAALLALAPAAAASLPWAAFFKGHPFRIRYMVPLILFEALAGGAAVAPPLGWIERRHRFGVSVSRGIAVLAVLGLAYELGPIDLKAPMVVEAQWDRPNVPARAHVTDCLRRAYHGESVLASMGSLGHYMQEMSRAGFRISDFVHEGNGDLWLAALEDPQPYAGWMLIEEKAEGGDVLAKRAREDPAFLDSFVRVCDGAGVALYRREDRRTPPRLAPRRQPRSSAAADGGQNLMPIVNR